MRSRWIVWRVAWWASAARISSVQVNRQCAWLFYLVQRHPAILVFIVRLQCVPCPSECIDNLVIGVTWTCSPCRRPLPVSQCVLFDMNVSLRFFERSELSNPMRSWIFPSSGLSHFIIDTRLEISNIAVNKSDGRVQS